MPSRPTVADAEYLREQRRFRRLEVSLPVWISTADAHAAGHEIWELGYTRDLSLGGAKVVVPPAELAQWRTAAKAGLPLVVRFADQAADKSIIPAFARHRRSRQKARSRWAFSSM